jgi:hypothetical protein
MRLMLNLSFDKDLLRKMIGERKFHCSCRLKRQQILLTP